MYHQFEQKGVPIVKGSFINSKMLRESIVTKICFCNCNLELHTSEDGRFLVFQSECLYHHQKLNYQQNEELLMFLRSHHFQCDCHCYYYCHYCHLLVSCFAAEMGDLFMQLWPGFLSEDRRGARPELSSTIPHVSHVCTYIWQ